MARASHYQPGMRIGIDSIVRGEPEVCVLAIGVDRVAGCPVVARGGDSRGRWVVAYADGGAVRLRRKSAARALVHAGAALGARLRSRVRGMQAPAPSWRAVGDYTTTDPTSLELESRPNPRPAPAAARAAKLVLAVALVAVTVRLPGVALAAALSAGAAVLAAQFGRWAVAYIRREFVQQWRVLACTLGPTVAFLTWVAVQIHANHPVHLVP